MKRSFYAIGATAAAMMLGTLSANAGLIAQYSFDESSGNVVADSVGTADGTATDLSFVASSAGVTGSGLGNAGVFNGTTSEVTLGEPASLDLGTGDFTITGWLKMPTNTTMGVFGNKPVFQNINYAGGGWVFEIGRGDRSYGGEIFFTVGGGSSSSFNQTQVFSDGRVDDDQWHWVAVTNSGGNINMYIDGVLQTDTGALVSGTSTATSPAGTVAQFGARGTAQALYDGSLDDWRVYDEALSVTADGNGTLTGGALFDVWQVPEPASLSLLMLGTGAAVLRRKTD